MSVLELLRWQWGGYPKYHRSRVNLLIHIVVVPLFLVGTVGLVASFVQHSVVIGVASLGFMVVSLALQGRGHRQEDVPPEPFTSPFNAVSRIFLEQWFTFPRFVASGGWLRALRQATKPYHRIAADSLRSPLNAISSGRLPKTRFDETP